MQTKPSDVAFSIVFLNFGEGRLEAAGDVISSVAFDYVGTGAPASFGDFRLNTDRTIQLFVRPIPVLHTFLQYSIAFCSRPEAASGVISSRFLKLIVMD